MNEEIKVLAAEFTTKIREALEAANLELEKKKAEISVIAKDQAILREQFKEVERRHMELKIHEEELQKNIELNRQRTNTLDMKERKIEEERGRLRTSLMNLGVE